MGTVNAIYQLGDNLCARLPRVSSWAQDLEKEVHWLPKLAPSLSLRIPKPLAQGQPASDYPFPWAIYDWSTGQPYRDDLVHDERQAADVIAAWSVFGQRGRAAFRAALDVDDGTWNRARGYALHQALLIIAYYAETNSAFVALAKRTVEEILTDSA
jgi:aminoglycoside phosphotransferase (APT) family kinase protein